VVCCGVSVGFVSVLVVKSGVTYRLGVGFHLVAHFVSVLVFIACAVVDVVLFVVGLHFQRDVVVFVARLGLCSLLLVLASLLVDWLGLTEEEKEDKER